ncbi:MAG: T9SS type A sorting domain-containing protein [Bacteroidales bacterium]|nr:T9SS type A sorting domain-containing protein [Bacteroidales bacterium]
MGNDIESNTPWLGRVFLYAVYKEALADSIIKGNYKTGPLLKDVPKDATFEVSCFPNPTAGISNIKVSCLNTDEIKDVSVKIVNSQGFTRYEKKVYVIQGEYYFNFDFANFSSGAYYLIVNGNSQTITRKVIVSNLTSENTQL